MPTDLQLSRFNHALRVVEAALPMLAEGKSQTSVAVELGVSEPTLSRWLGRYRELGNAGLLPKFTNSGRKSFEEKLREEVGDELFERCMQQIRGLNLDMKTARGALRAFALRPECPEPMREAILKRRRSKQNLPPSLVEGARVTPTEREAHKGRRALSLSIYTPRYCDILPGDVFTSDDTTPIWAWYVPWPEDAEHPFGVKLLQGQFLPVADVATNNWLTAALIARDKSSYRAADVWAIFGHVFRSVGLPRLGLQLERGTWEANILNGVPMDDEDGVSTAERVGGFRLLPSNPLAWHTERMDGAAFPKNLQIFRSFSPKSKPIEGMFNRLQRHEETFWRCLGRDQRDAPNEAAKKIFQACQRGAEDPRLHFLSGMEILSRIQAAMRTENAENMEGEVFHGVPENLFADSVAAHPLAKLPPDQEHLFAPDWSLTSIDDSLFAVARRTNPATGRKQSFFFTAPDVFARHCGRQVLVYFDATAPELGAHVRLARTGEFLGKAFYERRRGMFLDISRDGHDSRRDRAAAVMRLYGDAAVHSTSRILPAEIAARRSAHRSEAANARFAAQRETAPVIPPPLPAPRVTADLSAVEF